MPININRHQLGAIISMKNSMLLSLANRKTFLFARNDRNLLSSKTKKINKNTEPLLVAT